MQSLKVGTAGFSFFEAVAALAIVSAIALALCDFQMRTLLILNKSLSAFRSKTEAAAWTKEDLAGALCSRIYTPRGKTLASCVRDDQPAPTPVTILLN